MAKNIILTNLCKSFGDIGVFNQLNLNIKSGTVTCIMGPSGCGKTTLLRILAGLDHATGGTVTGVPTRKSMVFQEDRLLSSFTAITNVACVSSSPYTKQIEKDLLEVGLTSEDINRKVEMLSGGMRRRVAIVRAILAKPEIIFLDEPFKGLDEKTKAFTMEYVKRGTKGITTILVTHDKSECDFFGGNIIDLNK